MTSLSFDPRDPFPLLTVDDYSYSEAKVHSAAVDHWLGLPAKNQSVKHEDGEVWDNLPIQSLMTPYVEIRLMLDLIIKPQSLLANSLVLDLGCAYGRMAHVIGRHYPNLFFRGYEIVKDRVLIGQKSLQAFGYPNVEICQQDLSDPDFQLPQAQVYFIYDYGNSNSIQQTLKQIQSHARVKNLLVIARGRLTRHLIHQNHPWLCEVSNPRHFKTFSIYSS